MKEVIVECKDKIDTFNVLREDIDHLMYTNIYFKANIVSREIIFLLPINFSLSADTTYKIFLFSSGIIISLDTIFALK